MKACPKCQTKNQDSNSSAKNVDFKLSGSSFQDKKEKVLGERKRKPYWVPISLAVVAVVLAGVGYWLIKGESAADPRVSSQPKVSGKVDYAGQNNCHDRYSGEGGEWKNLHPSRCGEGEENGTLRITKTTGARFLSSPI